MKAKFAFSIAAQCVLLNIFRRDLKRGEVKKLLCLYSPSISRQINRFRFLDGIQRQQFLTTIE